ncbi:adenylosuccinate synthetase [Frankia sp. CNm7]|uniref:Adenylosuccinate synthetase n=1 Tax=Frankia nepalensis TaxID=1836974 RepID=A0A937RV87_9ACTN|nr:adenylosuccinate synthetase [Frankia nepalensis]MBL7495309.1 adenylosuccinate synthetase [Frankia nepalensis]MBL7508520.1 adenylosuccinate synthetase [Frankia nepalensis]MBL7521567.1 adenylosuccinate synthetase [Frankia nepalensis]MBL7632501.1 adenylosuccinate synthetase [Frankia nepalensis]
MRPRHSMVVDLGFGDAGKGTIVDHLCRVGAAAGRPVGAVVRFNGGAQAAHNVVTDDGRHHTFAQFGSGTLAGVPTHLSRHVLVDPLALAAEADHLVALGVADPFAALTTHRDALVITPYHAAANRARESARGDGRHGSCGMGIGETAAYALAHPEDAPRARDCARPARLRRLLAELRDRLTAELGPLPVPPVDDCVAAFGAFARAVRLVDDRYLADLLRAAPVVFEGAQGVLLDEWHGFHPYTTWSTTTFANAEKLLADAGMSGEATRLGVLRTYTTRHGAGPLVTEDAALTAALPDRHNVTGRWQGAFRVGHFDAVAHRYAVDVAGGVDAVALTHLDAPARLRRLGPESGHRRLGPGAGHPLAVCRAYDIEAGTDFADFDDITPGLADQSGGADADGLPGPAPGRPRLGGAPAGEGWGRTRRLVPGPAGDLARSAARTAYLLRARPVLEEMPGDDEVPEDGEVPGDGDWPALVAEVCGAPISIRSFGPRNRDKH